MNNTTVALFSRYRSLWVVMMISMACGCMNNEAEEDHHLEHLIPEHKPRSFAGAVEQLRVRGPSYLTGKANQKEQGELLDIIDWLPELAADSDLKREQWQQVKKTATSLKRIAVDEQGEDLLRRWQELVDEMELLVPSSETWKPQTNNKSNVATSGALPIPKTVTVETE